MKTTVEKENMGMSYQMANKRRHHFTTEETEYIMRNAGKVPPCIMAQQLKRTSQAVRDHAARHGISLRIPKEITEVHWREYDGRIKAAEA